MPTIQEAKDLVQSRIIWTRKGMNIPAYTHSLRVYEMLRSCGYSDDIQLAWLLHDIIEDGKVTVAELKKIGYSKKVIELIDASTHDESIKNTYIRREAMMKNIIEEDNKDAFIIKLADITDNLTETHLMTNVASFEKFMNIKCPFFIYQGSKYCPESELYKIFLANYRKQIQRLYGYFNDKATKVKAPTQESKEHIKAYFMGNYKVETPPQFVIVAWPKGAGKSRVIKTLYAKRYMRLDPAKIALFLTDYNNNEIEGMYDLMGYLDRVGLRLTKIALQAKNNLVLEMQDPDNIKFVMGVLTDAGYKGRVEYVDASEDMIKYHEKMRNKNNVHCEDVEKYLFRRFLLKDIE